eukprot:193319-Pelagomonas_calceolata.AAC.4
MCSVSVATLLQGAQAKQQALALSLLLLQPQLVKSKAAGQMLHPHLLNWASWLAGKRRLHQCPPCQNFLGLQASEWHGAPIIS